MADDHADGRRGSARLELLLSPEFDALFGAAPTPHPDGAGSGHAPFVAWLATTLRPHAVLGVGPDAATLQGIIVSALGHDHAPALCVELQGPGEPTRDPTQGSQSLVLAHDAPIPATGAGIDLVHVCANHLATTLARHGHLLSTRAVVLVRGTASIDHPRSISFFHDGGLTMLADGPDEPDLVAGLCDLAARGGPSLARLRSRCAALGANLQHQRIAEIRGARTIMDRDAPILAALRKRLVASLLETSRQVRRVDELQARMDAIPPAPPDLSQALARADAHIASLELSLEVAAAREAAMLVKALETARTRDALAVRRPWWRIGPFAKPGTTAPPLTLSVAQSALALDLALTGPGPDPAQPPFADDAAHEAEVVHPRSTAAIASILFVAGEPDQPGAVLRVERQCASCRTPDRRAAWARIEDVGPQTIAGVDMLVLWRAPWSPHVETMIGLCRGAGAVIVFDVDDLVVDPAMARPEIIDGLRFAATTEVELAAYFERFRTTALAADYCIATTDELAAALRRTAEVAHVARVVPNGFDDALHDLTRQAVRARAMEMPVQDTIRIGYAAGTRTHQRDFAAAAGGVARLMEARADVTLVLFREPDGLGTLVVEEFDELAPFAARIEWRDTVALAALPAEIARFDIAICPLEIGNPFCEAKSELKYMEAALASVPVVASPTGPMSRAIDHGRTGMLADTEDGWFEALRLLVDGEDARRRIGRAAYADVLWRFGPRRRRELWGGILRSHENPEAASREAELALRRGAYAGGDAPAIAETELVFAHDTLAIVAVAVAVTSYNYADYVVDALASVAAQTLDPIELVVVDDCSTDGSLAVIVDWAQTHVARFARIRIERTRRNSGLGPARNAAFAATEARHIMSLDADNRLRPECCAALLALLVREDAAFAYSTIPQFGDMAYALSALPFDPWRLIPGNYIDAMALVAKWAWAAVGGYYDNPHARGWEDLDLWCRLVELGQRGVWHREPLCDYRVHAASMTNAVTERDANKRALVAYLEARHPWLHLASRTSALR